jgi:hypothetical protein
MSHGRSETKVHSFLSEPSRREPSKSLCIAQHSNIHMLSHHQPNQKTTTCSFAGHQFWHFACMASSAVEGATSRTGRIRHQDIFVACTTVVAVGHEVGRIDDRIVVSCLLFSYREFRFFMGRFRRF